MNRKTTISIILVVFLTGCRSLEKISPFKSEAESLEPKHKVQSDAQKSEGIFVCAGDINATYKKLGEVSLGEFGFSGHDILARKMKEKAYAVGAQGVINVQYDTGASKTWKGYGELGGTDYGVKQTSWCKGVAVVFLESHNSLGLILCDLTKENKEWFGIKRSQNGALVANILPGSIAENAGIKTEDLITEWNGEKVESKSRLRQMIETSAGKEVKLFLLRAKEIRAVTLSVPLPRYSSAPSSAPDSPAKQKKPTADTKESSSYKLNSKNADVHNEVGDLYLRKGMYHEAIEEYKKAIEADPDAALSHFNLSIVYDKLGMKEEADEEFASYKRLKPKR